MIQTNPRCSTCRVRNYSVLSNCSNDILEALSDNKKYRHFQKGERLLIEGQRGGGIYFIRSGIAKVEVNGKSGRPLILRLAGAGSIFGYRMFGSKNEQPVSVEAVEDLYVCHTTLAFYDQLVKRSPVLHKEMMQLLLNEIRQVELHAVRLTHLSVKERVAGALLEIAKLYHYQPGSNGIRVHLERQDLADLSGTTKEQVSRMLAGLQRAGFIKLSGKHFKFLDLNSLQSITAFH